MINRLLAVAICAVDLMRPFFVSSTHSPSSLLMLVSDLFIMLFGLLVMVR
jgi:hypothetical protein